MITGSRYQNKMTIMQTQNEHNFKNPNHNFATILNEEMFVKIKILTYCT